MAVDEFESDLQDAQKQGYNIGVCVRITNDKGEILLIKRTTNDFYGDVWELPGGSVDTGEDVRLAAAREVHEETGLSVDPKELQYLAYFEFYNIETDKHKRKFAFAASVTGEVAISNEHSAYQWRSIPEIHKLKLASQGAPYELWDQHRSVIDYSGKPTN